jgi:hypothetical protein
VDNDLSDHPKVWALSQQLNDANAGWYLIRLWSWTSRYSSRGRIADGLRTALEFACGWRGEAGELLSALVSVGFLDVLENGDLEVHDWWEQQGAAVAKAEKDAERQRAARKRRADGAGSSTGRHADGHADERGDGAGTIRNETRRDETLKDLRDPVASVVEPVVKPPKPPKPPKPAKATDPRHHPTLKALVDAFAESRGADLSVDGRTAKDVSRLLEKGEPAEILRRWRLGLAEKKFPIIATPGELCTHWDHWAGGGPRRSGDVPDWGPADGDPVAQQVAL